MRELVQGLWGEGCLREGRRASWADPESSCGEGMGERARV